MTNDLYRKEAIDHSIRNLYGEVVLMGSPGSWLVTVILVCVMAILGSLLFWADVDGMALWKWLWLRAS